MIVPNSGCRKKKTLVFDLNDDFIVEKIVTVIVDERYKINCFY